MGRRSDDPDAVDDGDDAIVVDLTDDPESQAWLDSEPSFTTFDELSEDEKDAMKRRADATLDD